MINVVVLEIQQTYFRRKFPLNAYVQFICKCGCYYQDVNEIRMIVLLIYKSVCYLLLKINVKIITDLYKREPIIMI